MAPTPRITRDTVLARSREALHCEVDGDTVFMSIANGMYYAIDSIGTRIWALLEAPRRPADLCDILVREYDVPARQCEDDVLAFLHELASFDLVQVVNDPAPSSQIARELP